MKLPRIILMALTLVSVAMGGCHAATSGESDSVAVVYNGNAPESKALADFYCQARGIDPAHEIALLTSTNEEISRSEYDGSIAKPLRELFASRGYWIVTRDMMDRAIVVSSSIRYVVLIRGIPLKIKQCTDYPGDAKIQPDPFGGCNAASVDSELSVLGFHTPQISGVLNNPVCNNASRSVFNPQPPPALLYVARLDGPTMESVRTMVLNGIKAEKEGLWGWGYTDLRSITNASYARGDDWIRKAGEAMRRHGIPVITDDLPDTFQAGFPVTDASAYYGWYAENIDGPFADPFFTFVPGAVAIHLHSFSASTLHDPGKGWTGPLIRHGASASVGNVYEPYLSFTTDLGTMASTLLSGANLAESYYAAQPVLSWMSVLVGDPLYRPYACFASEESTPPVKNVWADYRRIVLAHGGDVLEAAGDLRAKAAEDGESLYLEALGNAQMDAGRLREAEESLRAASELSKEPLLQFRLLLQTARCLEKQGSKAKGAALLRQGLIRFTADTQRALLLNWIARLDAPKTPAPALR